MPQPNKRQFEGHQFGEWTVIERAGKLRNLAKWLCRCSCGAEHEVLQPNLVSGQSTRCYPCGSKTGGRTRLGVNNGGSKLNDDAVRLIRRLAATMSQYQLAKQFGISRPAIHAIVHGKTWKHVQ